NYPSREKRGCCKSEMCKNEPSPIGEGTIDLAFVFDVALVTLRAHRVECCRCSQKSPSQSSSAKPSLINSWVNCRAAHKSAVGSSCRLIKSSSPGLSSACTTVHRAKSPLKTSARSKS